jgi:molybdopterin synthase catalytic subunit/molybdopterin converting factor small subunit
MSHQVHVKFFAIFREYIGLKEDWREIEAGTTVQDLWNQYIANAKNPRVGNIRAAFSVNQRLAKPDTVLQAGDEVGFLPPVSGGAGTRRERSPQRSPAPQRSAIARKTKRAAPRQKRAPQRSVFTRDFVVTDKLLSLDALVARVAHPGAGGITTFLGVVRDNAHDQAVKFLEYEAYPELAERMLAQIGAEVQERWSDVRLAIAHRTGRLQIGEASVIIAASAPHRAEAFAACRYAIERLKVIVPVWKKEFASDTEYWVEGPTPGDVPTDKADAIVRAQEDAVVPPQKFGVPSVATEGGGEI